MASANATPIWNVESQALPTAFQPSDGTGNDAYYIELENIGNTASSGEITLVDHLPPGITTSAVPQTLPNEASEQGGSGWNCNGGAPGESVVTCTVTSPHRPTSVSPVTSNYNLGALQTSPATVARLAIPVEVAAGTQGTLTNTVTVSGGGAPPETMSTANPVDVGPDTTFGTSFLHFRAIGAGGEPYTQAGGHPYAVTTDFEFDQEIKPGETNAALTDSYRNVITNDEAKTIVGELPLGLIGDPQATPRCSQRQFAESEGNNDSACPSNTRVGVLSLVKPGFLAGFQLDNLVPTAGHAAEFGFHFEGVPVVLYGDVVRSRRGYVLRITALTPQVELYAVSLTFFGNPFAAFAAGEKETPFLTNPTDCGASEEDRTLQLHIDTWTAPGAGDPFNADFSDPNWIPSSATLPPVVGCSALRFSPSLSFQPSSAAEGGTTQADEPSGYNIDLKVPQTETFSELATPELKTATVTLPEGVSVSPSAANGLQGCSDEQIALSSNEPGSCPLASQIGTVKVATPLLENPLEGQVFLGDPACSPCGEADASDGHLFRLFIQIHSAQYGITIKLPGVARANPQTGRLTAEFAENPQLPFSDLELRLNNGARAPLANPQSCGTFTTSSNLSPWSSPETPDAVSTSSFSTGGCGAGFAPGFAAGTASPAAGAYSPLTVSFSRQDREQDLGGITVHTPPGLLGRVAAVAQCGEAQANAGTCGAESQIGTTTVTAGPGADPYTITGGRVYLTGPYKGQPFGLSIVVPAVAGPFNLGLVTVRASIAVNPATSALTVTSDPLPQIRDGVPFRLRSVAVEVNRPSFTLNATNCVPQAITATITGEHPIGGTEAAKSAGVSSPYAASGCANLPFKPSFKASTQARTSKANGASLLVEVAQNAGEANIQKVDVQLPKQLPSRLSTLNKACPARTFEENPANCPPASDVGTATATTPILNVPLKGPAYLVSHGGAAFPDLVLVLQGQGVTIDLVGNTNIKAGYTYSRFEAVPDAPISSFELNLPEQSNSILATNLPAKANRSMCGQSLLMPTIITGQNGKQVKQPTKIVVTGCRASRPLTRAQKLAKALKVCKRARSRKKRAVCDAQAQKRYRIRHKTTPSHGKGRK